MFKCNFFALVLCWVAIQAEARDGIIDGIPVTTMRQFPHQVSIRTTEYSRYQHYCSGSILNEKWILSSTRCVYDGDNFELIFNRTNFNDTHSNSFSLNVDNSSVFRHPIEDIALIKLPVQLQFSSYIQPITILSNDKLNLTDRFAVMPGKGNGTEKMSYGQFEIISPKACADVYGGLYNATTQICTQGYWNNSHVPCWNNEGGGLLINWPSDPILVGVFNAPLSCLSRIPAEYMRVTAFVPWINATIRANGGVKLF